MDFLKVVPAPVYHINCMVKVMSALIVSFFNDYYNSRLSFCKEGGGVAGSVCHVPIHKNSSNDEGLKTKRKHPHKGALNV